MRLSEKIRALGSVLLMLQRRCLSLASPIWTRDGAPSRTDRIVISRRERARGRIADILRDALGSRRADDRGADAGGADAGSERGRGSGCGVGGAESGSR